MRPKVKFGGIIVTAIVFAVLFFIFFPIFITVLVSFNEGGFVLPPKGLTIRWYAAALTAPEFTRGMMVSLIVGLTSAFIANFLGLMLALSIVRYDFRGKAMLNIFIMSPLLVPTTILGLALYIFLVRIGIGGGLATLIVGHTLLVLPFAVRVLTASLQNFDRSYEEASMNVGATPLRTMFAITLPIIKSGGIASMMLCFVISWNDFALSVFLASGDWVPLPIEIFSYIQFQYDAVGAALVSAVVLFSAIVIIILDRLVGVQTVFGIQSRR